MLDIDIEAAALTATLAGGIAVEADVSDSASVDARARAGRGAARPGRRLGEQRRHHGGGAGCAHLPSGSSRGGGEVTPLDALVRLPDDEWRRMLAVHLDGTFYGTRAAARSMAPRGSGAIVNIASVCGDRRLHRLSALLGGEGRHHRLHARGREGARGAGRSA